MIPRMHGYGDGAQTPVCHGCDRPLEGEPAGRGLLVFPRGDDFLVEEPPLCARCAHAIGMMALWRFEAEEDEG